jgi:AraC-like DNA-binding protein
MKEDFDYFTWPLETPPAGSAVWLSGAGHYRNGFGACRRAGVYDVFCPHFIISGRGVLKTPAGEWHFAPGDVFTLWPEMPYEFWEETGDDPLSFHWLWITGEGAEAFGMACGFSSERLLIHPSEPDTVALILSRIIPLYKNHSRVSECEVLTLMFELASACGKTAKGKSREDSSSTGLIVRAKAAIEAMLSTAVNVDTLARALNVSRNTLLNAFRKEEGMPPGNYIQLRRMVRAKKLLERTELPLAKIARSSGFANDKYLMRVFRKMEGVSPGEWRQSLKT